ncbi:MAG: hypothetical protein IPO85_06870 [Saprospiraceae bacterium]|uniref:Uncharacterized protein n=1 Tax=Candidatus Defluviibacterium haderslevense TaxID=2981993 RepID=A0A9D7XE42_9BACT|nr:hypothetical protein [Candidatus Defluviibacterium haderslevense]
MKDSISHLHVMCQDWIRELKFYKSEIPFFKNRLEEIVQKNTSSEILMHVEHFENKFRLMEIHIDELLHDVKLKDKVLLDNASEKPNYIGVKMIESDNTIADLIQSDATDFVKTKKEFYQFLAKYL